MTFRVLPVQLHPTAEAVVRFFRDDRGIANFKVEEAAAKTLDYRPTLQAPSREYYDVWVEVSESPYLTSLDTVVLHCVHAGLPVKLYVAHPSGTVTSDYKRCLDAARAKGVGVLEISDAGCVVVLEAVLLSLSGVRSEDHSLFPAAFRTVLSTAETTFKSGDPAKGCALIYDEIESLSHRLADKIQAKNWWTSAAAKSPPKFNAKTNWSTVMDILLTKVDFNKLPPALKKNLLIRVAALTDIRNQSGHKPRDRAALFKRDRELRTRFESAVDVLRDFIDACRPLRLGR